jgi:hypothetical protein
MVVAKIGSTARLSPGGGNDQGRVHIRLLAVPNSGDGKTAAQTCTFLNFRSAGHAVVCVGASDQECEDAKMKKVLAGIGTLAFGLTLAAGSALAQSQTYPMGISSPAFGPGVSGGAR